MIEVEQAVESEDQSIVEDGLLWVRRCKEKFGFVYTLGLIEFLSTNLKDEMSDDIVRSLAQWETKQ